MQDTEIRATAGWKTYRWSVSIDLYLREDEWQLKDADSVQRRIQWRKAVFLIGASMFPATPLDPQGSTITKPYIPPRKWVRTEQITR